MHKRTILWPFAFAVFCLATGALLSAGDVMAKKKSGGQGLVGWCWRNADGVNRREMCFGREPRLTMSTGNQIEGFEREALYRALHTSVLQIVGFPGEGWPSRSSLLECQFEIPAPNVFQLSGCDLGGRWDRSRKHTD